ncbi:MAG: Gx transporter family protein [Eubacteriales bacterium]|nr:Gx transporter family protein [Eubacteriales bacterium]
MTTKQITLLAALLAMSLVLSVVESMLGALIPVPIPGVKLGLANIIAMFILCYFSLPSALAVGLLRTFLTSLFTGGIGMFLYSAPGAVLSVLVMYAAMRYLKRLSIVGISMLGACAHNVMQVCVAVLVTGEAHLFYYAFVLLIVGAVSGTITGVVAAVTFIKASRALNILARHDAKYVLSGGM